MNARENALAILNYQPHHALPVVHFGYWRETLERWADEGRIPREISREYVETGEPDRWLEQQLGFDFNWCPGLGSGPELSPAFEVKTLETLTDGTRKVRNGNGVVVMQRDDAGSIPAEFDHLLKDRASWEEHFRPRLQPSPDRLNMDKFRRAPPPEQRDRPLGLYVGSLAGRLRDWMGLEGFSYLPSDDEDLLDDMIATVTKLCLAQLEAALATGVQFDYAHFWEDICFKNGPLVAPAMFAEKWGPQYRRITDRLHRAGIRIVSLDCDGWIDALLPTWFQNGVNTMFPIEVGTWNASMAPWREKYGRELRGVGGMRKYVFAQDRAAVDREIERLKPLVALGGYIPCPDHRIPPDAKWDLVRYYTERLRAAFGGG